MVISSICELKVVTKLMKTAQNGKTYFNLGVIGSDKSLGEIGCTSEVFQQVEEGKTYKCHYKINTAFLRKDYNCSINIDSIAEISADDRKSK